MRIAIAVGAFLMFWLVGAMFGGEALIALVLALILFRRDVP